MKLACMYFTAASAMLVTSVALAILGKDGWGWFLVAGFLMLPSTTRESHNRQEVE